MAWAGEILALIADDHLAAAERSQAPAGNRGPDWNHVRTAGL
jgi:hypothetical protein